MAVPAYPKSQALFEAARRVIPGGVTSSIRAGARPYPLYFERGEGPYLWDVDGQRYIDFALGYGPLLLGHAPRVIRDAVEAQLQRDLTFGSQHRLEPELAELLVAIVPGAEQAIFATTGSEAVAAALRLARAVTGRRLVVKFEGHYHGWLDGMFASVGFDPISSGPAEHPTTVPSTVGIPEGARSDVLVAQWNDAASVEAIFAEHPGRVAAVICEPIAVNGGLIPPITGFLEALRRLTTQDGALLVFDEVISGFRVALGGAQERLATTADLAIFAKAIAGGIPLSAVTGARSVMAPIADGQLAHNGTFNGNPIAMAAGCASVRHLADGRAAIYPELDRVARRLAGGLAAASPHLTVRQYGPIVHTAVHEPSTVRTIRDRAQGDPHTHARFIEALLSRGVHATPRGLWYVSTTHTDVEIDATVAAAADAASDVFA
ncbi:MAG TPA: aminotransferase class III-fold pyridoxal phosphate-dependent enzyme [Candidatus Limnocylindrales bacterium]|nr:aminotransferase class III-fold pyridoxal phosphate-dependent enzyme [Candidatus Limnocylindrales bacterium]